LNVKNTGRRKHAWIAITIAIVTAMVSFTNSAAQIPIQLVQWQPPITVPTPLESNSWFPNLAVDSQGNVHIVWCETYSADGSDFLYESIYYTMWNGNQFSQFTDIAAPIREIRRNSIAIDQNDYLHMSFIDSFPINPYRLGYRTVSTEDAFSANNWSPVQHINDRGQSYMNEIAVFENSIHVLYEDTGSEGGSCSECADMFYRRSMDGGVNWDTPIPFLPTDLGTARPHLTIDQNGDLYASWDEGWDRHSGRGDPEYGVFTFSRDLGETWSQPMEVRHPENTNAQLTVEGDGEGGIMLVWRTNSPTYPGVYFMWSNDYGDTWTQPATLPSFMARSMINYFDSFDMATDSAGHIHLISTGYLMASDGKVGDATGLYHFEWDGERWYPPTQIYNGGLIPEYPRLVIDNGNQLHVTWFVRYDAYEQGKPHQVMYTRGQSSAPMAEPPAPVRNQVKPLVAETGGEEPVPAATMTSGLTQATATLEPVPVVPGNSLYTEMDEYVILLAGIAPAALILGVAAHFILKRKRRIR
jgi:hypothetical protein